jgi:hypothetical protein
LLEWWGILGQSPKKGNARVGSLRLERSREPNCGEGGPNNRGSNRLGAAQSVQHEPQAEEEKESGKEQVAVGLRQEGHGYCQGGYQEDGREPGQAKAARLIADWFAHNCM